jgi:threonine/homoserine/homoserine lactone efflux protein
MLFSFVGVVLLGAISPGPDFFVLTRRATLSGRRAGLVTAAGMGTGILIWAAAVVWGVATVLAASAAAFSTVKLAGGIYLVLLGLRAWLTLRRDEPPEVAAQERVHQSALKNFSEGLLCNLLNPKVAVFYLALMPQFLPCNAAAPVSALLAAVAACTVTAWYLTIAMIVSSIRRRLLSSRTRKAVDATFGTVLIAMGIMVALFRR